MARIRTIKPEFFRHAGLYEAELHFALPLRLAFAGLWTAADREGRFRWRPRELKLDCLPYDDVDFSRVLDALATRGFLARYEVDGEQYGWIPGFKAHQIINVRERPSSLPEPNENNKLLTRTSRVEHASSTRHVQDSGEGKGREQEGKGKGYSEPNGSDAAASRDARTNLFREGLKTLTRITGKTPDSSRSLVGKWLKSVNDEAVHVLAAIQDAERNRVADPVAWINRALASKRSGKPTVHEANDALLERLRALDEPGPADIRDGEGQSSVRLLSSG